MTRAKIIWWLQGAVFVAFILVIQVLALGGALWWPR
jgi:hypothetical protein